MSYIEGIALLGVRSFSPDEASYLKFFSPVTVIVGPNGSGKTTIIESLKYACTGDLPPNSKGGAFVNDPKIAGTSDVKAQIKLKFRNVNGHKLVCSRSLQVTQKKTTISQKAIDNSLKKEDPNTGEVSSISSRCADMDSEIPLHLGVPKAVLDNVIFCHQEDSNWPLSESSVLKKKFDDIFSSKKYAVALDNLKDTNKALNQQFQINNTRLEALKAGTEKAKRIRATISNLYEQVQSRNADLERTEERLTTVDSKLTKLNDLIRQINANLEQIQKLETQKENMENTILNLQETITPRTESIDELKELLSEHRENEQRVVREERVILDKKEMIEKNTEKLQQTLSTLHTDLGRLQAMAEENERNKQKCIELIEKANELLSMDMPILDSQKAKKMLTRHLTLVENQNQKAKNEAMTKHSFMKEELEKIKNEYISLRESKKHLLQSIQQDKIQIKELKQKLSRDKITQDTINQVESNIKEAESRLEEVKRETNIEQMEAEINAKEEQIMEFEGSINDLNDECMVLNRQGSSRTKLALKRTEKEEKEETLKRLYEECGQDATSLLGYMPEMDDFDQQINEFIRLKKKEMEELSEVKNTTLKQVSTAGAIHASSLKKSNQLKAEIKDIKRSVDQVSGGKPVPQAIADLDEQIKMMRNKMSNIDGAKKIYSKFIEKAKKDHYCPLCSRGYDSDDDLEKFIENINDMLQRVPSKQGKATEQLKELEEEKVKLESVHAPWIRLSSLQDELVLLEQEMAKSYDEKKTGQERYQETNNKIVHLSKTQERAEALLKISDHITRLREEIEGIDQDINALNDELSTSGGSTRTVLDCQKEIEEISAKRKQTRQEIEILQKEKEAARKQTYTIENKMRDYKERLVSLNHRMESKKMLETQIEEYEKRLKDHEFQMETNENSLIPLQNKVEKESTAYEKALSDWNSTDQNAQANERHIRKIIEDIDTLSRTIQAHEASSGSDRLAQIMEKKKTIEKKLKEYEKEMRIIANDLRQIENDQINRRSIERDLIDQIKFQELKSEIEDIDAQLVVQYQNQHRYKSEEVYKSLDKMKQYESELIDKRGRLTGELVQVKEQISHYENELRTDYANVDGEYAGLFINVRTSELVTKDLDFYAKALKNAVMNYHTLKMKDLNKLIREMWVNTYKGGDIDYIEIKADNEGTAVNRSFNYRVVMYQRGTELNMRGRCSAGQKVLAAIIIRLALAEAFCTTCGVFTLDEPTTNLDRENIESLAENLAAIINTKRQQSNFQLVIITHDEEFVECLSQHNIAERYYRVSKDHEHHSTIRVQNFTQTGSGAAGDDSLYD